MKILSRANLVTSVSMALDGPFVGFAIGQRSEHDILSLETDVGLIDLRPGIVIPSRTARVEVKPVRKGSQTAAPRYAELYCFECASELAIAYGGPRRNYQLERTTGTAGAAASVHTVPFAGRRHVQWVIRNTDGADSLTWTTKGRRYFGTGASDYDEDTLDTGAIAAGVTEVRHEGGSDHEEMFDTMVLELVRTGAGDATYAVSAEVTGELGG